MVVGVGMLRERKLGRRSSGLLSSEECLPLRRSSMDGVGEGVAGECK
jgi:hypothetical protein